MRLTTKRLMVACGLYLAIQIPGAVVSVIYRLPGEFVLPGEEPAGPDEVLGEILSGAGAELVTPAPPLITLILFMVLARSRRWWGTFGVVGICALSVLFTFAMLMEPAVYRVFPPSASELPVAVMVTLFLVVPLLMFLSGILDLISRVRTRKAGRGLSGSSSGA